MAGKSISDRVTSIRTKNQLVLKKFFFFKIKYFN